VAVDDGELLRIGVSRARDQRERRERRVVGVVAIKAGEIRIVLGHGGGGARREGRASRHGAAAGSYCANGHRLSKIVTKTGDAGTTGLGDGSRVAKDSSRIAAIGEVDELNSTLGVLLAEELPADVRECLTRVQHDLFDLGGELSIPGYSAVTD